MSKVDPAIKQLVNELGKAYGDLNSVESWAELYTLTVAYGDVVSPHDVRQVIKRAIYTIQEIIRGRRLVTAYKKL